uniref:Uncharacterized protein n=1 Tax=Candidatus Kentrum eta TaxID=2126337 RepID=A0A450VRS2_9GAMM|nr:MAG: hypothetical protein BECKH772B_GA0070898_107881 [Candidatus Kentron sp. H]
MKLKTRLGCIDSQHLYFAFLIRFAMVCSTSFYEAALVNPLVNQLFINRHLSEYLRPFLSNRPHLAGRLVLPGSEIRYASTRPLQPSIRVGMNPSTKNRIRYALP